MPACCSLLAQAGRAYLCAFRAKRTLNKLPFRFARTYLFTQHRFDGHCREWLTIDVEITQTGRLGSDIAQGPLVTFR